MKLNEYFKNVFSYSQGVEKWCKDLYKELTGYQLKYTFISDLAIVDWNGTENDIRKSFNNMWKQWSSDYQALTELCIAVNLLAWANDALIKQGIEGRLKFAQFYSEFYYTARDKFHEKYKGDNDVLEYFFEMTD